MPGLEGHSLGPYRLVEYLGRGWMAEVYRAEHRYLGREAAVKILAHYLANDVAFLGRFRHEAAIVAALDHPHILPVWEYGEQDGHAYVVTPFIRRGDLVARLHRGPVPLSQTLSVLRQLAQALDYVHARGIVHRDVRPATILLGEREYAYLTDFGLVAALAEAAEPHPNGGLPLGVPEYLAPEQALGRVDFHADLYALAVIAYELLAGQVPFHGASPAETLAQQIEDPLPVVPLQRRQPALSLEVPKVLQRALAKDPAARYQTGNLLVTALAAALTATVPAAAYPAGLSAREVEVLRLLAAGHTNHQIAALLSLSERTVHAHVRSIFTKTRTDNRAGATAFAFRHDLV